MTVRNFTLLKVVLEKFFVLFTLLPSVNPSCVEHESLRLAQFFRAFPLILRVFEYPKLPTLSHFLSPRAIWDQKAHEKKQHRKIYGTILLTSWDNVFKTWDTSLISGLKAQIIPFLNSVRKVSKIRYSLQLFANGFSKKLIFCTKII